MDIGTKIKSMRMQLLLTQEELANRCELTKSYISLLENNKTSPSIHTLTEILEVLGTTLGDFFSQETNKKIVFRESEHNEKEFDGYMQDWLVPTSQKLHMEPIIVRIKPNCQTTKDNPHDGQEFGYVIEGSIIVQYGNTQEICNAGEAFYFTTDKQHFLINNSDEEAKIIWVSSPPNF